MKILSREERKALSPEAKKQYMAELNAFIETEKKKLEEVIELIKNASDYDEYELVRGEDQTKLSLWINEEWKTNDIIKVTEEGTVAFRGFKGRYRVCWKDENGNKQEAEFYLMNDGDGFHSLP